VKRDRIVWIDMEMTGLDPSKERVIEIAVLVSDSQLEVVAEGPELVIHQDEAVLAAMDEWNTKHHTQSGLVEKVRASTIDEDQAQRQVLEFLGQHCSSGASPIAGNSIHQDKRFLQRYLPKVDAFLHYRIIDVSTIKELVRRWYPEPYAARPAKRGQHRAMDDIRESIEELRYYRQIAFKPTKGSEKT